MIAIIGLPGSTKHRWISGPKKECLAWLDSQGDPDSDLITDAEAARIRYRDGTRVYPDDKQ